MRVKKYSNQCSISFSFSKHLGQQLSYWDVEYRTLWLRGKKCCRPYIKLGKTRIADVFCNVSLIALEYVHYKWFVLTVEVFYGTGNSKGLLSHLIFCKLRKSHSKASHPNLLCKFSLYSLLYFLDDNITLATHPVLFKQDARSWCCLWFIYTSYKS